MNNNHEKFGSFFGVEYKHRKAFNYIAIALVASILIWKPFWKNNDPLMHIIKVFAVSGFLSWLILFCILEIFGFIRSILNWLKTKRNKTAKFLIKIKDEELAEKLIKAINENKKDKK